MRTFSISCPPYYEDIQFCITPNKEDARVYFLENFKVEVGQKEESVAGYCINSSTVTAIWLPGIPQTPIEFGTLHHEVYHAVCNILERRGVKDRGEPYAYLLGYIIHAFYQLYAPIRKPDLNIFGLKIWLQ